MLYDMTSKNCNSRFENKVLVIKQIIVLEKIVGKSKINSN